MFGRGVRLTALTSFASASVYCVNNNTAVQPVHRAVQDDTSSAVQKTGGCTVQSTGPMVRSSVQLCTSTPAVQLCTSTPAVQLCTSTSALHSWQHDRTGGEETIKIENNTGTIHTVEKPTYISQAVFNSPICSNPDGSSSATQFNSHICSNPDDSSSATQFNSPICSNPDGSSSATQFNSPICSNPDGSSSAPQFNSPICSIPYGSSSAPQFNREAASFKSVWVESSGANLEEPERPDASHLPPPDQLTDTFSQLISTVPPKYNEPDYLGPLGPERFSWGNGDASCDPRLSPEGAADLPEIYPAREESYRVLNVEIVRPNEQGRQQSQQEKLKAAINKARDLCWGKMYESGSPGMVVSIAVNGKVVWQHGFGYADLENRLIVGTGCIMRIASISKTITMAVLAKLVDEGKVDLDASVSKYVPTWPEKSVDGEKVDITVRQLCSHLSGVRHYEKKGESPTQEFEMKEYYIKDRFKTTEESLALFKNDELMSKPGTEFLYSTHGFTLLAAVIEHATGEPFDKYMKKQFCELGLQSTYLDENGPIIYNRSKNYVRDEHHILKNAPYVDCSYKWAGGGFLSNAQDLTRFGNAMLYSYQKKEPPAEKSPQLKVVRIEPPLVKADEPEKKVDRPQEVAEPKEELVNPAEGDGGKTVKTKAEEEGLQQVDFASEASLISPDDADNEDPEVAEMSDIVFSPSPYSAVNNTATSNVKYLPGYLRAETVAEMWKPVPGTRLGWGGDQLGYGLGWAVRPREKNFGFCKNQSFYASHTGGAIGASSVLLVAPQPVAGEGGNLPQGVVVAILCNLQGVGLNKLAVDIAKTFEGITTEKPVKVQKVYQC